MNVPEKRLPTYALIPWICAVVAILGCNALGGHALSLRKLKCFDGSSLTQVTPDIPATGNAPIPPVFLAPDPADGVRPHNPLSTLLAIANRSNIPTTGDRKGTIRGRAPPVEVR